MKEVKTITVTNQTYRENFEAIVTKKTKDKQEYIIAAFLLMEEALNYVRNKDSKTIHLYQNCKSLKIFDRFREIKY